MRRTVYQKCRPGNIDTRDTLATGDQPYHDCEPLDTKRFSDKRRALKARKRADSRSANTRHKSMGRHQLRRLTAARAFFNMFSISVGDMSGTSLATCSEMKSMSLL